MEEVKVVAVAGERVVEVTVAVPKVAVKRVVAKVVAMVAVMVAAEVVATEAVTAVTACMVGAAGAAHRAPSLLRTKGCHLCTPDRTR